MRSAKPSGRDHYLKGPIPQIDEVPVLHPDDPLHAPHRIVAGAPRGARLWDDLVGHHPRSRPHAAAAANHVRLGRVDEEFSRVPVVEIMEAPGVICR